MGGLELVLGGRLGMVGPLKPPIPFISKLDSREGKKKGKPLLDRRMAQRQLPCKFDYECRSVFFLSLFPPTRAVFNCGPSANVLRLFGPFETNKKATRVLVPASE